MPETISPVTREEDYLAAIAGQDVTPPTPVTRKEEWLDLIADKVDDLAGDLSTAEGEIDDLQDIVPTPAADDSGKVLTAGADGTASWQTASGGGESYYVEYATCTGSVTMDEWYGGESSGYFDGSTPAESHTYYAMKGGTVTVGNVTLQIPAGGARAVSFTSENITLPTGISEVQVIATTTSLSDPDEYALSIGITLRKEAEASPAVPSVSLSGVKLVSATTLFDAFFNY